MKNVKRVLLTVLCFMFVGLSTILAQTRTITGAVTENESGTSVPGAAVFVKGTTIGTVTQADGRYSVSVPQDAEFLVVSFVGMRTQEVEIAGRAVINVILHTETTAIDEVVVTAMGIMRSERSVGTTKTVVNPDDAVLKAEPDLFRSLNGKIPGVNIQGASAVAGSSTKVNIRGNMSFFGSNQPLYVVDGIPYSDVEVESQNRLMTGGAYGSGLSTLDPNDIESMNVLKGAAAAALYGGRASNGVILITTKSGSKKILPSQKKTEVTLSASMAMETIAALPDYQNSYGAGSNFQYSPANGSWGAPFGGELTTIPTWSGFLTAYPDMPEEQPYQAYPNNVKDLFRTGKVMDLSANITHYTQGGNFSTTVSRLTQDSYIPFANFERTSFSVGGNQKLDNGITIGGTMSYSRSDQEGPFFGAGNYGGSVSSFARTMLLPRNINPAGMPYETPENNNLFPFIGGVDSPLWSWKYNKIKSVMDRTVTSLNAGYDITQWLSAYYSFGWNQYEMDRKQVINIGSVGPGAFAGAGQIMDDNYTTQEIESNFNLTFKQKFLNDFELRVIVGHNANQFSASRAYQYGNEMIFREIYNIGNSKAQTAYARTEMTRLWAIYGDVLLGYKNYAFLNFTLRNDHSSTLPVKHNSFVYPGISGSFIFSDAFGVNTDILNYGKFRMGWGKVGKDASAYYVNGFFNQDTPFAGIPLMYVPMDSYDEELRPEFTSEFETGVELQFLQSRIGVDFTWYNRLSTDQIAPVNLPSSTGKERYFTNYGEMRNRGIELGLTLVPVSLQNSFKWNINAVYSKNVNEVLSLIDGVERLTFSTGSTSEPQPTLKVGYSYGYLYGSGIARDKDGTPLVNPNTGTYMVATDLVELGSPYPDFQAAVTNTFSFKGIYLSAMFDARVGGVLSSGPASDMMGRGVTKDTEDRLGTRILQGVYGDPNTQEPIVDAGGNRIPNTVQLSENDLWFAPASTSPTFAMNSVQEFSTFDATVFRLSEVTLGYDFPKQWLQNTFLGSVNVSVIARNLWHYAPGFPKYTNYDPGSNSFGNGNVQGIDRETAPSTRRFAFNVKVTF
ncbi:MAG: SusC/RagA family TonB-linked outer membrane protein [Cytophagaceae bacterium]|jgi:TonB-linked SusC/RagA family outer membrane protein|nr:SusC/RagA family TonB-linked outer membrane protein [Cytophagaceae bacterium]